MPRYVAFLRGINLGNRRLKMADLRTHFEALKFGNVSTFIASGNVLFDSPARDAVQLEQRIERHLEKTLGYAVDTFVRTRAEVTAVASAEPFAPSALAAPVHGVYAGFFKEALAPAIARRLEACRTEVDAFRVIGREYYWLCRVSTIDSEVWTSPAMRALKLPTSSMRNLTTLRKLAALFDADA